MRKLRVLFLALMLAVATSGATATIYAEGPTETPGVTVPVTPPDGSGGTGTTALDSEQDGPTETPGLFETLILIMVDVI